MYKSLVEPSHPNCQILTDALATAGEKARALYGDVVVDKISSLDVQYYGNGRNVAMAMVGRYNGKIVGLIQFSMQLTRRAPVTMANEIVPHEYAHILCMANRWEDGHGARWKEVCIALGGTGETTTNLVTIDGRTKCHYEALDENGASWWLTAKQLKMAAASSIVVADATGRRFTLTKNSITGKIRQV